MELKPGYKRTEVGVIPDEWEANNLGRFWAVTDCKHVTAEFVPQGFPLASIREVQSRFVDLTNAKQTTVHFYNLLTEGGRKPRPGDLILSRNATVGEVAQVAEVHPPFAMGQDVCLLRKKSSEHSTEFLQAIFRSPVILRQLADLMVGSTFKRANVQQIRNFAVPMPPPDEQRAIAEALSDVDGLLGGLDRLIAKKRDLKQAAMQQLLTAQTRLPGFHGAWQLTKFENVVRHHAGNSTLIKGKLPSSEASGLFPAYSASGQDVWCGHYEHEGHAIIVSAVGSRCGKAFKASGRWCAIANTHVVWPNSAKIEGRFLAYFINDENFWEKSGTGQPFVLFTKTFARPLHLPSLPEQTAIAEVLTEMDAELAALEQRREKTRALKQAMMQDLLTGRTRLV